MNKILVAITNCWMYRNRQDVIRRTWLQDKPVEVDVRFFLGRPFGSTLAAINDKREDEVFVNVDDGYPGLPAKTQQMCKYALENGYEWLFKTDDDVYLRLERLIDSDFAQLGQYVGRKRGPSGNSPAPYASGFSYWLIRKAMKVIADAKLTDDPAEDRWVGNTLLDAGIPCTPDYRYVVTTSRRNALSNNEGPRKGNTVISSCEYENDKDMMQAHEQFLYVASKTKTHQKDASQSHLSKVCIVIKTFLRDGYLLRTIEGIRKNLPECKIVIVDDGYSSKAKVTLFSQLRQEGHACEVMPFDSGFGAKANEAVRFCDRPFVLIGSDDFAFGQAHVRADVIRMVETLEQTDLDLVSGRVNNNNYESVLTELDGEVWERKGYRTEESCAAGKFNRCDLTVNYSMIRRTLLNKVGWDGDVKIGGGEHGMFFLDIQRAGGKVAYLPGVNIEEMPHNIPGWQMSTYPDFRGRAKQPGRICAKRRGISKYHLTCGTVEVS